MLIAASNSLLPAWLVLPIAGAAMLVVAAHVLSMQVMPMPSRRRRIRTANGLLMLFVTALLAYALGVAEVVEDPALSPRQTRDFLTVWFAIVALVGVVVVLAGVDAMHTIALGVRGRKELRRRMRAGLESDLAELRRAGVGGGGGGGVIDGAEDATRGRR